MVCTGIFPQFRASREWRLTWIIYLHLSKVGRYPIVGKGRFVINSGLSGLEKTKQLEFLSSNLMYIH